MKDSRHSESNFEDFHNDFVEFGIDAGVSVTNDWDGNTMEFEYFNGKKLGEAWGIDGHADWKKANHAGEAASDVEDSIVTIGVW